LIKKSAVLALPLLIYLILGLSFVQAQQGGWSEPVPLSPQFQSSWFPDITVDSSGRIHVVWSAGVSVGPNQAYDVVYYTTSSDGGTWSTPRDIVALPSKGAVTRPSILTDDRGIFHITFRDYTIYYSQVSVNSVYPNQMTPSIRISTPENGYFSRLAIDKQGDLNIVYTEDVHDPSCPGCFHVFFRKSADDGKNWTLPIDVSPLPNGAAKPQIVFGSQDIIHVVWEAGQGGDLGQIPDPTTVAYSRSTDGGKTWSPPYSFQSPGGKARNITIGRTGDGQLVVAWLGLPENAIYYATSVDEGQTWSEPELIPGISGAWDLYQGKTDDYSMATDSAGNVHLVFVGRPDPRVKVPTATEIVDTSTPPTETPTPVPTPNATQFAELNRLGVMHLTWNGTKWSSPEAITYYTGDVPEWPRIAINLGNTLDVAWFVRDKAHIFGGEGAFQYRVWFSQENTNAPEYTPQVPATSINIGSLLTPIPSPSAISITPTSSIASPTPIPTFSPASGNTEIVYQEKDYLKIVGISIMPVILFIVIAVFITRWRSGGN
jgi:hypothetical protein